MVLNDDILRHICDLLPPETLRSASATHPVFFDRWIKEKYRRVDLSRSDKQSKRLWKHVQDSEWVARSVKSVHMRTWLVKPQTQTYQSRTENALNTVAMLFDKDHTKKQVKKRLEKRLKKDLWHITSLFSVLRGIQDYHIEWDKNPTFPPQLFAAFLQPLYAWRDTLTSLSIHIPVDLLNSFVTATLPNLQHIHVCLSSGKMSQGRINIHLDGFLVFLHNLKDTLTSFSVRTTPGSESLELSRFFRFLGTFPHLRAVSLMIPFDGAHLPDPQPFCKFIHKHSATLESLALKTTRCTAHAERIAPECFNWIQTILASAIQDPFPELQNVVLALRPLRAPFGVLMDFLRLHSPTLKSVALTDRMLELGDVCNYILPALTASTNPIEAGYVPLKTLEMRVDALQPRLLNSLWKKLPWLKCLKLDIADRNQMGEIVANMRRFERDLDAHGFGGDVWDLKRLEMSPGPDGLWIVAFEKILRGRIPSLECVTPAGLSDSV
ncbi:hypothetical protein D9611_007798 [Ephemerocybe angulata]|uniref:F-box domain-containing protein n=1 Tax=Ephemerocybe angulata TaxID=980116 RepID=A0A8H5CEY2_9AGAR|nr:hypothetical protein D9611_007798 [Tulosesus angulatus]